MAPKATTTVDPLICDVGGRGVLLPFGGDGEQEIDKIARAPIYLFGLIWCFLGVGIISDIFMSAIETVTSRKKRVQLPGSRRMITVRVWNDTVANLTLMALGSSAPEIMLSVIELAFNDFYSGELGPSTIVGSAAFNLLIIIAVCVYVIPDGDMRYVKEQPVFRVTSSFSMFAYAWLVIILMFSSPDVIEIWEGLLTFLYFPALVSIAYAADIGMFGGSGEDDKPLATKDEGERRISGSVPTNTSATESAGLSDHEVERVRQTLTQQRGVDVSEREVRDLLSRQRLKDECHISRAVRRCEATRAMLGCKRLQKAGEEHGHHNDIHVGFCSGVYEAHTNTDDCAVLTAVRYGCLEGKCEVEFKTNAGSAVPGEEFLATTGKCCFAEGQEVEMIKVPLIKSQAPRIGEFHVELSEPKVFEASDGACSSTAPPKTSQGYPMNIDLGVNPTARVCLVASRNDNPGQLRFKAGEIMEIPPFKTAESVTVAVLRENGTKGDVQCRFFTERESAIPGFDYVETSGILKFVSGQSEALIPIEILPKETSEMADSFRLILEEAEGGATFNPNDDGGEESCILTCTILSHSTGGNKILQWFDSLVNFDEIRQGNKDWKEQFVSSVYVNGDPEEQKEAGAFDWIMHVLAFPWKVLFAFCPPTAYCGGWLCFCTAIIFIGVVTAFIGDMASLFGCCAGIPDPITAITFVALGTSLPDTFASKTAAIQDEYADASIGNVTGSNSVNVFLGLGMPWAMGAIVWSIQGATDEWKTKYPDVAAKWPEGALVVRGGDLGFTVTVFLVTCLICLGVLKLRRVKLGCELGGPRLPKILTSGLFVLLWAFYIALASWKSTAGEVDGGTQVAAIGGGLGALIFVGGIAGFIVKSMAGSEAPAKAADGEAGSEKKENGVNGQQEASSVLPKQESKLRLGGDQADAAPTSPDIKTSNSKAPPKGMAGATMGNGPRASTAANGPVPAAV